MEDKTSTRTTESDRDQDQAPPARYDWRHDVCPVHGWTEFIDDLGGCVQCHESSASS